MLAHGLCVPAWQAPLVKKQTPQAARLLAMAKWHRSRLVILLLPLPKASHTALTSNCSMSGWDSAANAGGAAATAAAASDSPHSSPSRRLRRLIEPEELQGASAAAAWLPLLAAAHAVSPGLLWLVVGGNHRGVLRQHEPHCMLLECI